MSSRKNKEISLAEQLTASLQADRTEINLKRWAQHVIKNKIPLMDIAHVVTGEKAAATPFIWMVGGLCESNPEIVSPAVGYFYSKRHDVQIINFNRSLAKMFWLAGVPKKIQGEAIDDMFKWVLDAKVVVSTKNYSLLALHKLSHQFPELKNELKIVIRDQMGKNSIAFEKCAGKIFRELEGAQ